MIDVSNLNPDDIREEQLLARLEQLDRTREAMRKNRGMDFYVPNQMQFKAHQSLARTVLYVGGNRAGKSTFGAMELCFHLTRKYPDWYPLGRRFKKPIKAVISATEYPVVDRVIEPKIKDLLPKDYYKIVRTSQQHMSRILCVDGSMVDVLTSEMDDEAYESADWDFAWEDEPQQQKKREGILRGLVDRRGIEVITFTPLTEPWMKEELIDKVDGKRIELFQVTMRDNKFTLTGEPILIEEVIQEFEQSLSEDVRETRIAGVFFTMRGLVYKEFSDAHQVSGEAYTYKYPNPVICVLDPHDRLPHHLIWAYIDRDDDIVIDYEMVIHCELDDLAKKIKEVETTRGYKMKKRLIDPNFGRKPARPGTNTTVINELARHGAYFFEADDNKELGHHLVRDLLHFDRNKPLTAVNKPKIYLNKENCPRTIRSLRNYQYDEWHGSTKNDKDPKEAEKQKDTHGADVVRYLAISRPRHESLHTRIDEYELATAPY